MKTPPWAKSSLKLETAEGQLWQRAFSELKPTLSKNLSKYNLSPNNIELLNLTPIFQEDIPKVGGYYTCSDFVIFLPLNTQEFILEKLLGGAGGQTGFQGTGLLGKRSLETFLGGLYSNLFTGAESFKEFELTLKTSRFLCLELNFVFENSFQASLWIPWNQRKTVLAMTGVEDE